MDFEIIFILQAVAGLIFLYIDIRLIKWLLGLRRVVATNEVHIVASNKKTISYGKDMPAGNTYYEWPIWIPKFGITKIVLPVSVFDLDLDNYEAYDMGRLPFVVDVKSFFRIEDSNLAAQRVSSFEDLKSQLDAIVQGAVRTILASNEIEVIMQGRSEFGEQFTKEVKEQLVNWGVVPVKNIELMDIRDSEHGNVIEDIMNKKKSLIEMQSRLEVAENKKKGDVAEIEAKRETEVQQQAAAQKVGERTAATQQAVGIAKERATQNIASEARTTKEKEMEVIKVAQVKQAEINKDVHVVKAEEDKRTSVVVAEGQKEKAILDAEGVLESERRSAEGVKLLGEAKASAEAAIQLAPVNAQIELAREIGDNKGYQEYLVSIEQIAANQVIGIEQAKALETADVKVISNAGNASEGLTNVGQMFTSSGGTNMGAMLEAFAQTEQGQLVLNKLLGTKANNENEAENQ